MQVGWGVSGMYTGHGSMSATGNHDCSVLGLVSTSGKSWWDLFVRAKWRWGWEGSSGR